MTPARAPLIDALRGLALLGILLVNIQSFSNGIYAPSLGILEATSSVADRLALLLTAALLEYKFYPIFCFCFGYGFAVQSRKWVARGWDAKTLFSRRLTFMLVLGVLHGVLIWFGDILSRYALVGFILRRHIGKGPVRILGLLRFWGFITILIGLVYAFMMLLVGDDAAMTAEGIDKMCAAQHIYLNGTWFAVSQQRLSDYLFVTMGFLALFPQVMVLFLLGALCAHMGWLRHPQKASGLWRRVLIVSLAVGLPMNVIFTFTTYSEAFRPGAMPGFWHTLSGLMMPFMAASYVATLALMSRSRVGQWLVAIFAPAGRLALSNYILQSLVLSFLLYGYGAGWGSGLRQADLALLACALYAGLLTASHAYARTGLAGPLEALWRRYVGSGKTGQSG